VISCENKRDEQKNDRKGLIFQQEEEKATDAVITVNKDLGSNYLESRINSLRDMYYKVKLENEKP
jgi:hypothetical protein